MTSLLNPGSICGADAHHLSIHNKISQLSEDQHHLPSAAALNEGCKVSERRNPGDQTSGKPQDIEEEKWFTVS